MNKILLALSMIVISLFTSAFTYAQTSIDQNDTLHLYMTNETQDDLRFDRIISSKPGNTFVVNPQIIKPGETTHIIAERLELNDINGFLLFVNSNGDEALLHILDPQRYHTVQPAFEVLGKKYHSKLLSKIPNKNPGGRYLMYVEAKILILE